ncbi:hypothetical protein M9Y10_002896 [Tritrichomonas musculus]|uniref:Uncharacterized protein n=1 Tax=Tritrichomonas musculus TaxID=1915356 RepID=A0ABR2LB37_9EUKA
MTSELVNQSEDLNEESIKLDKNKPIVYSHFNILPKADFTTPLTRKFNNQPRIYADIKGIEQDYDTESFLFSKAKTKDDLFQESQERVLQHLENIIQSQNDTFNDSFREIDQMSQENEEHLEKIEKYLEKLKKKMLKKRKFQQKPKIIENPDHQKPAPKISNSQNQRANNLIKLNQKQLE